MSTRVTLAAGQTLFQEGDRPTSAFLIEQGELEISARREQGVVKLAHLGPGDLLGEMAVIDDSPRTATAVALSDCVLLSIDRRQIGERLDQADPIIRALLEGQLKRYRGALAAMQGRVPVADEPPDPREMIGIGKIRLDTQLREALQSGGLDLRLQPLLEIGAGRIAGYEALVRWTHPERGPVSPAEFIALAEETSLIVPVGEYVLDAAIAALTALREQNPTEPLPFIAINVSARQLAEAGLIERILERTRTARLPPGRIKVEITESQALDYKMVDEVIAHCHREQIEVALDDFGTGFSNLGHLHKLPFDTVKVDQAFARSMMQDPRAMALVEAILQMIRALGAHAVVEGVETRGQLDVLTRLGCRYAQGYLIGKPQPLADVLGAART